MITVKALRDLEPFGIVPLTGEADNLIFRMLCDLTQEGAGFVADTYGIDLAGFQENWNPGSLEDPHVGSVMLPYDAWKDVGIIALMSKCHMVLGMENSLIGLEVEDFYRSAPFDWDSGKYTGPATYSSDEINWVPWPFGKVYREFKFSRHPREGSRNVHQFTGRSV